MSKSSLPAMTCRLLLVRHATAEGNGRFQGQCDVSLTSAGRRELRVLCERCSRHPVRAVYSSDLRRARKTADAVARKFGLEVEVRPDLREMHFGQWQGLWWSQIARRFPKLATLWIERFPHQAIPGAEPLSQFQKRIATGVREIVAANRGQCALIVTHAGVIRFTLWKVLGLPARICFELLRTLALLTSSTFWKIAQSYGASMAEMIKGFVVAGSSSGVGKTTLTLALMAAFRRRGMQVQPFKCGPDFIDAGHHTRACGRPSRNLDGWMLSVDRNRDIFRRNAVGAEVCIVEGVMGLFDGASGKSEAGSTAEMAKLLGLSVVLVVDASSVARSVAALVHGFESFDPEVKIQGVIFNKVAGPTHYTLLRDAVESACRAVPLGYLPRDERIQIPERYLGLFTAGEDLLPDSKMALLAEIAERHIDLEKLLESAASFGAVCAGNSAPVSFRVRVGVARDRAFCFYYEDNFDALRMAGAEIVEFSPMEDSALPSRLDALYFGGGYPELYANQLSANREMIASVKKFADEGGAIYAECGGLMYLANEIVTRDNGAFSMAGVLHLSVQMTDRLVNFGYAEVCLTQDCLWGADGARARGHSFHCSTIIESARMDQTYRVSYTLAKREEAEGFHIKNVLASYIHLHFLSCPGLAATFVENVQKTKPKMAKKAVEEC